MTAATRTRNRSLVHRAYPPRRPCRPLGTFRRWLAGENTALIGMVQKRILARVGETTQADRELLLDTLTDIYLSCVQGYDLELRLCFTTYAVASMQRSGMSHWMHKVEVEHERRQRTLSLDWRRADAETSAHADNSPEFDRTMPHDTATAPVDLRDLRRRCKRYLSKREYLVVWMTGRGMTRIDIAARLGTTVEYIRQVLVRAQDKLAALRGVLVEGKR